VAMTRRAGIRTEFLYREVLGSDVLPAGGATSGQGEFQGRGHRKKTPAPRKFSWQSDGREDSVSQEGIQCEKRL